MIRSCCFFSPSSYRFSFLFLSRVLLLLSNRQTLLSIRLFVKTKNSCSRVKNAWLDVHVMLRASSKTDFTWENTCGLTLSQFCGSPAIRIVATNFFDLFCTLKATFSYDDLSIIITWNCVWHRKDFEWNCSNLREKTFNFLTSLWMWQLLVFSGYFKLNKLSNE